MPLRKRPKQALEAPAGKAEGKKKKKRQRLVDFFRPGKRKVQEKDETTNPPPLDTSRKPPQVSQIAESAKQPKSSSSIDVARTSREKVQPVQLPSPPLEPKEQAELLSEEHIHTLFLGAPHFAVKPADSRSDPKVSYPWDDELKVRDVSDSIPPSQPAFSLATLRQYLKVTPGEPAQGKTYLGYDVGVVEIPSMLTAQGVEPGTIGFEHFLQLPTSDNLTTDLQQSQSSNGFLEVIRNKEQMQSNPERLGIRRVDMSMVHERLIEFGDLLEAFQESPERMTILNNQSSGDLYANLFGKFLTPPPFDGTTDDPTGMKVQIDNLLKVLRLKGVWYDLSLVEWRIRLGQILWGDPDSVSVIGVTGASVSHELWSDRDILLLQLLLACELLLRLDAVSTMDVDEAKGWMHLTHEEFQGFLNLKTRKTDWDLILARRFMENILVFKEYDNAASPSSPKPRGILSMLSRDDAKGTPNTDIIFLPRHQARQLSGLLHFAETVRWPGIDLIVTELAHKLGVPDSDKEQQQQPSPYGKFLDLNTPSSISVYGTPLATPRSTNSVRSSYFGHMKRPPLNRSNTSRSFKVPLTSTLLVHAADVAANALNIGGWLSRSYLTGLILPGEAISHFLISTLLENDKLAIATLGESANLYGGFIYAARSWWSKTSVVGRVLACVEGAVECMGWISVTRLPEDPADGWYAVNSEQIQSEQPPRISVEQDVVARDSAIIPGGDVNNVKPEDISLPLDPSTPPVPSIELASWSLTPFISELSDNDSLGSSSELESYTATLTFTSVSNPANYTLALTYDIHFIPSYPCTPPPLTQPPNFPQILKRSLSRSSSKRSVRSTRSSSNRPSRHPSRRNSHGYEPLLSHPPDSPSQAPTRVYSPVPDEDAEIVRPNTGFDEPKGRVVGGPMGVHPLHREYRYKMVTVTEVLDPGFTLPFTVKHNATTPPLDTPKEENEKNEKNEKGINEQVLILDARASRDLELLARAWCAEKGLHAIIGRVGRTCLACCVREARGLGLSVVVRV
ncbi:hypothetical protein K469DRAFT_642225 [Zopfia rhizophila CBS 207.26]|uniref:Uncharacterized protein n=1 Tax=Zopfia rhizophila CBS 207.26 TaxID=1314779 RepID=A0A6A6DGR0_9PEZI|nr:hypothetical protein K469DRAFT_642225 [Zopfia rhizophila CBS 207.26]